MLSDNLRNLRRSKGLSQDELAIKLNVVRQTVSKWEKGLSVPDSEMLIRLAEELGTTVGVLLGEAVESEESPELKAIAAKLEVLNEQFAKRNEKRRKIWRTVFIVVIILAAFMLLSELIGFVYYRSVMNDINSSTSIIGGYDAPTDIYVSNISIKYGAIIAAVAAVVISIVGLIKTKRS